MFVENFKAFADEVPSGVRAAGPHVAKRLLSAPAPSGILHIEQLLSLETLLSALDDRLCLAETSCS